MTASHTNDYLPIPSDIPLAELRRQEAILSLAYHSVMESNYLFHQLMVGPTFVQGERLPPRHPFVLEACKLLGELSEMSVRAVQWIDFKWNAKYSEGQSKLRLFVPRPQH